MRAGFTLLELLVVIVIAGVVLALVAVNAMPNGRSKIIDDSEKIARLFALADEETQLRARPLAWEADLNGWRFVDAGAMRSTTGPAQVQGDVFAPGRWTQSLDTLRLTENSTPIPPRLVFGQESVGQPFRLTLARDGYRVDIIGDGSGQYQTEPQ